MCKQQTHTHAHIYARKSPNGQICYTAGFPTLTPKETYSCPGETVTFTCAVTNGDRLYWRIDYFDPSFSDVSRQRYLATDKQGDTKRVTNNVGYTFVFNLTSNSPLISTTTTNVSHQLSGTQVYCEDIVSAQAASVIHVVEGMNNSKQCVFLILTLVFLGPVTISEITVDTMSISYRNRLAYVTVLWKANRAGNHEYFITIMPPIKSGSNFLTTNDAIQLSVSYNQEYNFSVIANNCAGNSTPVSTIVTIGKVIRLSFIQLLIVIQ